MQLQGRPKPQIRTICPKKERQIYTLPAKANALFWWMLQCEDGLLQLTCSMYPVVKTFISGCRNTMIGHKCLTSVRVDCQNYFAIDHIPSAMVQNRVCTPLGGTLEIPEGILVMTVSRGCYWGLEFSPHCAGEGGWHDVKTSWNAWIFPCREECPTKYSCR